MPKMLKFSEDIWWKLASLALAVMIWVAVSPAIKPREARESGTDRVGQKALAIFSPGENKRTRTLRDLPIVLVTRADDPRGFIVSPSTAAVTVTGLESAVDQLTAQDVEVFVSLKDVVDATDLRKTLQVRSLGSVTVDKIVPPDVQVKIVTTPQANGRTPTPPS